MTEHEASRTLVKSPPELWSECSDAAALARHLGQFGEIRITKLEPETAVAWEGEEVSGTVRLEPSGWGTRVILTACATVWEPQPVDPLVDEPAPESAPEPDPIPPAAEAPEPLPAVEAPEPPPAAGAPGGAPLPPRPRGLIARLLSRFGPPPRHSADYESPPPPASVEPPEPAEPSELVEPPETLLLPDLPAPPRPPASADAETSDDPDPAAVLCAALDSLGRAHHRPFSRA